MKVEPISKQVLIKLIAAKDERVKGGVILPEIDWRQRDCGKILAAGTDVDPDINIGAVVCFPAGEGTFIDHEIDGKLEKCVLLESSFIKYIIEEEQ